MTQRSIKFISAIIVSGLSSIAFASMQGDVTISTGLAVITPNTSVGTVTSTSAYVTGLLANTTGKTKNTATPTVSVAYMFTDNIAGKFNAGLPPKFTLDATIPALGSPQKFSAVSVRAITPVAMGQYLFFTPEHCLRPYVGLGVTYATFKNINVSSDPVVQALAGTYQSLSPSWAPVVSLGSTYRFNDTWSMSSSWSYIPLKSNVTLEGPGNGGTVPAQTSTGTITFNPVDYVFQIGYNV